MSKTVLLSGVTGFLGSHIAQTLLANDFKVIAIIRNSSDLSSCLEFKNENLIFLNSDSDFFDHSIKQFQPTCLIHAAWHGVDEKVRNDWTVQVQNVVFTTRLLTLAKELKIKKIIAFGSQAEYGNFNGRVDETAPCNPLSAYGTAKLATLEILKSFCELNSINWFWLRIFSLYGKRQKKEFLIPSLICSAINDKPLDLTASQQYYDYLFTDDFTRAVLKILEIDSDSGIFNLSSNTSIQLKEMIEKIKSIVNPNLVLNFGQLPYRPNQVMHMEGDSTKFYTQFNYNVESDFETNIKQIARYFKNEK